MINDDVLRSLVKSFSRHIAAFLVAAFLSIQLAPICQAAPIKIPASATTLESNADRMISYRHQEHMWQTSDGATHVIINRGSLVQSGTSLRLYSSFDSGKTWTAKLYLGNTGSSSTSDGVLTGNNLSVAYSSVANRILFSVLHYNEALKKWSLLSTETVFDSSNLNSINPAIAIDKLGRVWCAFVSQDPVSLNANIKLAQRLADGSRWQDTGLVFGPTDNIADNGERSARPVIVSNGVGMVYTVHQNIYWAYRLNGWPTDQQWPEQTLFTSDPPYDPDPHESHFSVATDEQNNLHMATIDHQQVLYFRYLNQTQMWDTPRILTNNNNKTYVQVSTASGKLAIFFDVNTYVTCLLSADHGQTFDNAALLIHSAPPANGLISYSPTRMETPGLSNGPFPLLQQYLDGTTQKLMYFQVPIY